MIDPQKDTVPQKDTTANLLRQVADKIESGEVSTDCFILLLGNTELTEFDSVSSGYYSKDAVCLLRYTEHRLLNGIFSTGDKNGDE